MANSQKKKLMVLWKAEKRGGNGFGTEAESPGGKYNHRRMGKSFLKKKRSNRGYGVDNKQKGGERCPK